MPRVFRFDDVDAFRSSIRDLDVDFTPLARKISAEQIILSLPGCELNYTQSFPRIVDAQLAPHVTAVGFTMDDGTPMRFNGVERDRAVIVLGSGGAFYTSVEETPRKYASVVFTPAVVDRGWPKTDLNFTIHEISQRAQDRLREVVREILRVTSQQLADSEFATGMSMRESLLGAIDKAFERMRESNGTSRTDAARTQLANLSAREREVLEMCIRDRTCTADRRVRAHAARRHPALPGRQPASLFAAASALAGAPATPGRRAQRQGLRAGLRVLAPQRFLAELPVAVR